MHRIVSILIISFFLLLSCSKDDGNGMSPDEKEAFIGESSITVEGETYGISNILSERIEDEFLFLLDIPNYGSMSGTFYKDGNYGEFSFTKRGEWINYRNLDTYPDDTFTFKILKVDGTNNLVSISFSGTLFEESSLIDDFDGEDSALIEVSGELNLPYVRLINM